MKIKKQKGLYLSCNVAGFSHYEGCTIFPELQIGTQLRLVREDENPYDHDAVAIFYGDTHMGYVPASDNEQLAMFLDMGYADMFEVCVQMLDPTCHPEHQVRVGIFVKAMQCSSN
jgi:hypothetical protein